MFKKFLKTFNTLITKDVGKNNQSSRDKWIKEKLSEIPSGSKILDAGAGDQRFKEYCQHLNYVSQDIALYDGEGDGKGIHVNKDFNSLDITSDIISIPVENESFDAIMCIEVLEHVVDPVKAMKELDRILKKNGTLILTTPFKSLTHYAR